MNPQHPFMHLSNSYGLPPSVCGLRPAPWRLLPGVCCLLCVAFGLSPAVQGAPYYQAELVFSLHAQHNHAPGIVETAQGDLIASWYRGSGERRADDVAVYGARRLRGQSQWSEPFLLVDTPGFPDCNTCLWIDRRERLWLFWPLILANSWESCLTQYAVADGDLREGPLRWNERGQVLLKPDDFGPRAQALLDAELPAIASRLSASQQAELNEWRVKLGDKLFQRLGWQPRCKPTRLASGRILLPLYTDTFSISIMAISDDDGQSWRASQPLIGFGNIQPTVLQRNDGTLVAYMRENGPRERIRVAESSDQGETWGTVGTTALPNPGAGIDAVRLRNGHWVLVYNDSAEHRRSLAIATSHDEGRTWSATRHLERADAGAYHYPAVIQGQDDRIHVIYSYFVEGGKSMKHVELNEVWIEGSEEPQ